MVKRILAIAFAALLSMAALVGCSSGNSDSQKDSQASSQPASQEANAPSDEGDAADIDAAETITVVMTATDVDGNILVDVPVQVASESVVFDVLQASEVEFVATDGEYGPYITSIAGVDAGTNTGWIYLLNDEEVMVGSDQQVVADGDVVSWQLIEF